MPKVSNTRKQRALEFLRRLRDGPSFGFPNRKYTPEEVTDDYRLWSSSWMVHEAVDLIPELRRLHKAGRLDYKGEITIHKRP